MTKKTDSIDFEADSITTVSEESLSRLSALAQKQVEIEIKILKAQDNLLELNKQLLDISHDKLPGLMSEIGMESFTLASGERIEIKQILKASIPAKFKVAALKWLRDHGHGDLIKNEVTASFGRGEEKSASSLLKKLEKGDYVVSRKESVHAGTLGAFVKEQLAEGEEVPHDLLGVFQINQSKVRAKR